MNGQRASVIDASNSGLRFEDFRATSGLIGGAHSSSPSSIAFDESLRNAARAISTANTRMMFTGEEESSKFRAGDGSSHQVLYQRQPSQARSLPSEPMTLLRFNESMASFDLPQTNPHLGDPEATSSFVQSDEHTVSTVLDTDLPAFRPGEIQNSYSSLFGNLAGSDNNSSVAFGFDSSSMAQADPLTSSLGVGVNRAYALSMGSSGNSLERKRSNSVSRSSGRSRRSNSLSLRSLEDLKRDDESLALASPSSPLAEELSAKDLQRKVQEHMHNQMLQQQQLHEQALMQHQKTLLQHAQERIITHTQADRTHRPPVVAVAASGRQAPVVRVDAPPATERKAERSGMSICVPEKRLPSPHHSSAYSPASPNTRKRKVNEVIETLTHLVRDEDNDSVLQEAVETIKQRLSTGKRKTDALPTAHAPTDQRARASSAPLIDHKGIFERTGVAMVITNVDGNFVDCNAAFCGMFGYGREEMLALNFYGLTHPDSMASTFDMVGQILQNPSAMPTTKVMKYISKSRSVFEATITCWATHDGNQKVRYMTAMLYPVRADQQARSS